MEQRGRLLILYATETGNAQDVAERIGREAGRLHYQTAVVSMHAYDPTLLPTESAVIFVASTAGQGDPPGPFKNFWKQLLRRSLGHDWLKGVQYGVFGLGDSGYQKYNIVAKKLDRRLADLGAKAMLPRGLGDDQHRSGYEAALDPWLVSLWAAMREFLPVSDKSGHATTETTVLQLDPPRFYVTYHQSITETDLRSLHLRNLCAVEAEWNDYVQVQSFFDSVSGFVSQASVSNESFGHRLDQPVFAHMIKNERVTAEDHEQNVRHIEFDLGEMKTSYSPGDVLNLVPRQNSNSVTLFIKRLGLNPNSLITVEELESHMNLGDSNLLKVGPIKVQTLVENVLDVDSASPRRYFFEVMSHFAEAEHEKEKLEYFATSKGRDDLYQYNQRERQTVLEVLQDFPSVQLPLEWVIQLVPRLKPRAFSISSSLRAHANQVHITVAAVEWTTPYKRKKHGLCSSWLSQLNPRAGDVVIPLWITHGALRLPPPAIPLILVGPGTGCAPFRGFIEDRKALSQLAPVAPILFFFGCRYESKDFLYKEFWKSCTVSKGPMSLESGGGIFVAFSRNSEDKVYVQHKLRENSKMVWALIQSGAAIFIAGSANKMPAQVTTAFEDVIVEESGVSGEAAERVIKDLERKGRFNVEAFTMRKY